MTIYADQTFDSIDAQTSFNIVLLNDAKLLLVGDCENVLSVVSGQRIRIYNFKEDSVYVGTNYDPYIIANRLLVYETGNEDSRIDVTVSSTGWLTALTAVPEPAEWAMIFGGLTLAFAIYRRRK